MGKYSLDSFQRYESLVIRPGWHVEPPENPGYGLVQAFPGDLPLVSPADTSRVKELRAQGLPFALLLQPDRDGFLNTAQALAGNGLQKHWQAHPVYARLVKAPDAHQAQQLRDWHVRACNQPAGLGLDLRLRRLACPRALSSSGALPLRLWLANMGAAPVYGAHRVLLRLSGEAGSAELTLGAPMELLRKVGDIVYNEIVRLPALPAGDYTLLLGFAGPNGGFLALNTDAPARDGLYALGEIRLDSTPRPELFTLWDSWYPDGYYPLEDPAQPGEFGD